VRRLVLFDIDGTLVLSGRAGVRAMNLAFDRLHAHGDALDGVAIAGRTDRAIVTDAMAKIGVDPTDASIEALRDAYVERLRVEIGRPPAEHPSLVLPGVSAMLDALAAEPRAVTALLTGNFHLGAAVKLQHFDLWHRFQFGAYGDRHVDRRQLVPVALEQARAAGLADASAAEVVIIGDTPHDVDCAKAHGARVLAVATGGFDRAALTACGADLAVDTLEDVPALLSWMTSAA
jgi:phosphoglycolate phosphatase-like HAD superfamily hydrolase